MQQNLIGFGSADGLGSSCGCSGSRRAGMAGFGAGPDGLGNSPMTGANVMALAIPSMLIAGGIAGTIGYFLGGAIGRRNEGKNPSLVGAASGAALGGVLTIWQVAKTAMNSSK